MGLIPKKGVLLTDLTFNTAGAADGSHKIAIVEFTKDDKIIKAYFKPLDENYPELLAKMSVATALILKVFLGDRAAEERLVFNAEGIIVGSLSIALEGFIPFAYANQADIPTDPGLLKQVVPDVATLIERDVIALMVAKAFSGDDDVHPGNIGLRGIFDYDMAWYFITVYMKGPRAVVGVPGDTNLTTADLHSFPILSKLPIYHWPANQSPGERSIPSFIPGQTQVLKLGLPKQYVNPGEFRKLAGEMKAHEQKLAAMLKILVTFEPDMVMARLEEYFGDISLNYKCLETYKIKQYETIFPSLFNSETNTEPFRLFMMKIYQKQFDNLYRVVVFDRGCLDNGFGLRLAATADCLFTTPSYYQKIAAWAGEQNALDYPEPKDGEPRKINPSRFNLELLEKRYLQVWRDTRVPDITDLLQKLYALIFEHVAVTLAIDKKIQVVPNPAKKITDNTVTNAWELFNVIPGPVDVSKIIDVDVKTPLALAFGLLVDFQAQLQASCLKYYAIERTKLQLSDNVEFVKSLRYLFNNYDVLIQKKLGNSSFANAFSEISFAVDGLAGKMALENQFNRTDEQMLGRTSTTSVSTSKLPLSSPNVIRQFSEALFETVRGLDRFLFEATITHIIDNKYQQGLLALTRKRGPCVKTFLKISQGDTCDNRLAYILSSGTKDLGELNTLIISELVKTVLAKFEIPSISDAFRSETLAEHLPGLVTGAVQFAKENNQFNHPYSARAVELFYQTMYQWIDHLNDDQFKTLMKAVISEYKTPTPPSFISSISPLPPGVGRSVEVEGYMERFSLKSKVVAMTFVMGGDRTKLNTILYKTILREMKFTYGLSYNKGNHPGLKLAHFIDPDEHPHFFDKANLDLYSNPIATTPEPEPTAKKDEKKTSSPVMS